MELLQNYREFPSEFLSLSIPVVSSENFPEITSEIRTSISPRTSPGIVSGIALGTPLKILAGMFLRISLGIHPKNLTGIPQVFLHYHFQLSRQDSFQRFLQDCPDISPYISPVVSSAFPLSIALGISPRIFEGFFTDFFSEISQKYFSWIFTAAYQGVYSAIPIQRYIPGSGILPERPPSI